MNHATELSPTRSGAPAGPCPRVVLCRDCGDDSDIRRRLGIGGLPDDRVRAASCLNRCDYADVAVVQPSPQGRRAGGRPTWFGFTDVHAAARVAAWIAAGGPGIAALPDDLALHVIERPGASAAG